MLLPHLFVGSWREAAPNGEVLNYLSGAVVIHADGDAGK